MRSHAHRFVLGKVYPNPRPASAKASRYRPERAGKGPAQLGQVGVPGDEHRIGEVAASSATAAI